MRAQDICSCADTDNTTVVPNWRMIVNPACSQPSKVIEDGNILEQMAISH